MTTRIELVLVAVIGVGLALVPAFAPGNGSVLNSMQYVLALAMVAIGLNIVTGYAGLLSLGPGAIFAVGGYAAALLVEHHHGADLGLMCLVALAVSAVCGLLIGIPALRIGGFYLAMVTLFLALLVPVVASAWAFTGGTTGISLVSILDFYPRWTGVSLYELTVVVVIALTLLSWLVLRSRLGRRLLLIDGGDELPASLGVRAYSTKLLAFVLSALPAGLGGAFYAYSQQFMSPQSASANLSIYLVAACVIGGLGTVAGPLVGSLVVLCLMQFLGGLQDHAGIYFGVALIVFALGLPKGLVGAAVNGGGRDWRRLVRLPRASSEAVTETAAPAVLEPSGAQARSVLAPAAEVPGLSVRGACRSFGGVQAVAEVDLTVTPGSVHGLIGSNGSGKTTLLNLVSGYYSLDAGEIWHAGRRIDGLPAHAVARTGIARTFQTPKLVEGLSLLDNVVCAASSVHRCADLSSVLRLPRGVRADRAARTRALECLDAVGLADRAGEAAEKQSHGVRRTVEIARALASSPATLMLDEPAAGLSEAELERLREVIASVTAAGVGVLLIEHNLSFVFQCATDVTVLHQGRSLASGSAEHVRADELVRGSFLGAMA